MFVLSRMDLTYGSGEHILVRKHVESVLLENEAEDGMIILESIIRNVTVQSTRHSTKLSTLALKMETVFSPKRWNLLWIRTSQQPERTLPPPLS
jgi:hypothetical protein